MKQLRDAIERALNEHLNPSPGIRLRASAPAEADIAFGVVMAALPDLLFEFVGTWHVRHADGTTEDIRLDHGNLVEDASGTCGQFLLTHPDLAATAA